jgi:hypothetical protein
MSKQWMKKKEQPDDSKQKSWADCGYLTLSKKGNVLSIVIKNQRFISKIDEVRGVLDGKRNYCLIFEHVKEEPGE